MQHSNVQPNTGHSSEKGWLGNEEALMDTFLSLCLQGCGEGTNEAWDAQVRAGKGTGVSRSLPAEGWG